MATAKDQVEYDAQGKPLPKSPQGVEYDAEGKPLTTGETLPVDPTGKTPTGDPAEGDTRNGFQRWADNMTTPDTRREEWQSPLHAGVDRFAQHVAGSVLTPLAHPIQTGIGLVKSLGNAAANSGGTPEGFGRELISPMIERGIQSYADEGPAKAIPGFLGDIVGGAATAELGGAAAGGVARVARPLTTALGGAMERGGLNLGNAALGARGPKPFQYGANPARGAFDEGILPSMSKHSAAMKTEAALPLAGERISHAVTSSPNSIPLRNLSDSIESPINEARGVIRGPGGGNRSVAPLDALQDSMQARAPGAMRPIYGPGAGTPYSAEEAAQAMTAQGRRLLPAPQVETPLHLGEGAEGRLSRPITLSQFDRPMRPQLPVTTRSTPFSSYADTFPDQLPSGATRIPAIEPTPASGMGQGEYIGQVPGERGGPGMHQGILRRPAQFPASSEPSPLLDLRHPTATPSDVWKTVQNIDKNTRFNPDPEVEGVNEIRRSVRGGLRGNLEDAVPGLKPLSQRYSDLKGVETALDKTMHSGTTIGKMASVPMFPVESAVGRGLYEAGKALPRIEPYAEPAGAAGTLAASVTRKNKEKK